ncbi:hypothetical protein KEM52_003562 [Ascosphaera acerosa]|nr:hypothetical protein KEM52_003562 [Ascosphaera acerosa]
MAVCSYYQMGRCRFGSRCKNEHPGATAQLAAGQPFDASKASHPPLKFTAADITQDLTAGQGRPQWIFSCYAPARDAPVLLFGGPEREQSFEEMRLRHYEAVAAGNPAPAIQHANALYAQAEGQMQTILANTAAAVKYVVDGVNQHPNRYDVMEGRVTTAP